MPHPIGRKASTTYDIPAGWTRKNLTLPERVAKDFEQISSELPHSGIKIAGTAAMALFCALPKEQRDTLIDLVNAQTFRDPNSIDVSSVVLIPKSSADILNLPAA